MPCVCSSRVELALAPHFSSSRPASSGIEFINKLYISNVSKYETLLNGSGVVASDFNNDGLVDIFFAGLDTENKLFLNNDWNEGTSVEKICPKIIFIYWPGNGYLLRALFL